MLILARVVLGLLTGLAALATLAFVAFLIETSYEPNYDETHPDHGRYSELFSRLRDQLDRPDPIQRAGVDLSALNGGQWTTACLFGGYTDPLAVMRSRGALIDARDRARLTEAKSRGFRASTVEEFEALIAYMDGNNRAHFVHFENGFGVSGQHFEHCISKPDTMIPLAPW